MILIFLSIIWVHTIIGFKFLAKINFYGHFHFLQRVVDLLVTELFGHKELSKQKFLLKAKQEKIDHRIKVFMKMVLKYKVLKINQMLNRFNQDKIIVVVDKNHQQK